MPVTIREEIPDDIQAIHRIDAAAFETEAEAALVDALRLNGALTLSLVATADSGVVGHIAYSPVTVLRTDGPAIAGIGLGPMAFAAASISPSWCRSGGR